MLNKSVFVLTAIVTIAASVTAAAAVSVAAAPIVKNVTATPITTPVNNSSVQKVYRVIPGSLGWSCVKNPLAQGYICTDPVTGNRYNCPSRDPSTGDAICEVWDDNIPGSGKL